MLQKIIAGMGAFIGLLLVFIGFKNRKIDKLEDQNEILEFKDKINDDMNLAETVAKKKELERNEKRNKKPVDPDDQYTDL